MFSNDELRLIFTKIRNDNPNLQEGMLKIGQFETWLFLVLILQN